MRHKWFPLTRIRCWCSSLSCLCRRNGGKNTRMNWSCLIMVLIIWLTPPHTNASRPTRRSCGGKKLRKWSPPPLPNWGNRRSQIVFFTSNCFMQIVENGTIGDIRKRLLSIVRAQWTLHSERGWRRNIKLEKRFAAHGKKRAFHFCHPILFPDGKNVWRADRFSGVQAVRQGRVQITTISFRNMRQVRLSTLLILPRKRPADVCWLVLITDIILDITAAIITFRTPVITEFVICYVRPISTFSVDRTSIPNVVVSHRSMVWLHRSNWLEKCGKRKTIIGLIMRLDRVTGNWEQLIISSRLWSCWNVILSLRWETVPVITSLISPKIGTKTKNPWISSRICKRLIRLWKRCLTRKRTGLRFCSANLL